MDKYGQIDISPFSILAKFIFMGHTICERGNESETWDWDVSHLLAALYHEAGLWALLSYLTLHGLKENQSSCWPREITLIIELMPLGWHPPGYSKVCIIPALNLKPLLG